MSSITSSIVYKIVWTMFVSMLPIVELRGGIPLGVGLGLSNLQAFLAALIGNLIPIPFLVFFLKRVLNWLRIKIPKLNGLINKLEQRAEKKGKSIEKYEILGLTILVAIPLPGTGAWTGALVASVLGMEPKKSILCIIAGVLIAGIIITFLTYGVQFFLT